jgi:hypothetical protein
MDTSRWRDSALNEAELALKDASALLLKSPRSAGHPAAAPADTAPLAAGEKLYLAVYYLLGVVRDRERE